MLKRLDAKVAANQARTKGPYAVGTRLTVADLVRPCIEQCSRVLHTPVRVHHHTSHTHTLSRRIHAHKMQKIHSGLYVLSRGEIDFIPPSVLDHTPALQRHVAFMDAHEQIRAADAEYTRRLAEWKKSQGAKLKDRAA